MKVCIIGPNNLRLMPYLSFYEDVLHENDIEYDILFWDRFGLNDQKENAFGHREPIAAASASIGYARYRRYLLRHLSANRYDLYIVLSTQIAALLFDFLFRRRFVLDIRDFSHENFLPYRLAVGALLKKAALVSISSDGFRKWLPPGPEYVLSHNVTLSQLGTAHTVFPGESFIASYIGIVGYLDANSRFITTASKIPGLQIRYVGRCPSETELESFRLSNSHPNVHFLGEFEPGEKGKYFHETNFVIGCYGNDSDIVKSAIPNRLYESCVYRRPIIVNDGTYLEKVVTTNGIGIVTDLHDRESLERQMRNYYDPGCWDRFDSSCCAFLDCVRNDITSFKQTITAVLKN